MPLNNVILSENDARALLGVDETAGPDKIYAAYRTVAAACHPDKTGSQALFRLVNEAYLRLSEDPAGARQDAAAVQKHGTFAETVRRPDFACPFKAFLAALEFGRFGFLFDGRNIELTPGLIDAFFIRTHWPAAVELRTYKNLPAYLLDCPSWTTSAHVRFGNRAPKSREFFHEMTLRGLSSGAKYYRLSIRMDLLDTELSSEGSLSRLRAGSEEIMTYVMGPFQLDIKCTVRCEP